jgi:hypothetical protein
MMAAPLKTFNPKEIYKMITTETSQNVQRPKGISSENQETSSRKIIDFFAAREALRSEAKSVDKQAELQQQLRSEAGPMRHVHLPDPLEDAMLLLLLVAAVVLGLLVISGFG